jgi:branched-chain amino acid aminotransferase
MLVHVNGCIISLGAQLDRLFEGARSIALDIGMTRDQVAAAVEATLARNGMQDGAHLRLMVARGIQRTVNQDPRFVIGGATVVIVAEFKTPRPEVQARGLKLFTSTFRTSGPDVFDLRLNSHSRLNLIGTMAAWRWKPTSRWRRRTAPTKPSSPARWAA